MADGKNGSREDCSPSDKKQKGRTTKNYKAAVHDISIENSDSEGDDGRDGSPENKSKDSQTIQMQQFADMLSAAMGTALASVMQNFTQSAPRLPPSSKQDGDDCKHEESGDEDKDKEEDEVDKYDKTIGDLIGNRGNGPDYLL